eukprot:SAG31_NODE_25035_length_469_cov_0.970270_1_plen_129_part_10
MHNQSITGASGSAVILSATLRAASGYFAVAFASGTMWGSKAEDLQVWEHAVDKDEKPLFKLDISPTGFGANGDNNAWLDIKEDRVYYLAAGIRDKSVDAAALYRSTSPELGAWELVTEFYTGSKADYAG